MPQGRPLQSTFTSGVLDPRLTARVDIRHYFQGIQDGRNLIVLPQGGVKRRPGLEFIGTALDNGRLFAFSFNVEQSYLLVFTALKMQVYKDGVLQTNLNGSGNDFIVAPYILSELPDVKTTQSADTMILVHPDHAPRSLVRGATDTDWTISTIIFTNVPQFDYNDASSPTPTSEVQDITFTTFAAGDRFKLVLGGAITEELVFSSDTTTNANQMRDAIQKLFVVGNSGVTVAFTAGTTYRITIADESADNFDLMTGTTTAGSGTIAFAAVTNGVPRKEDVWSVTRGFPRTVAFYLSRLWFGGTKSKPDSYFASVIGDFFNFDLGEGFEDQAIFRTMATDQVNAIENVNPGRHFQIFTSGGEFYIPEVSPTPEKSGIRPTTKHGSKNTRIVEIDGATLFVERKGKVIREFLFTFVEEAYKAAPISILAPNLIKDPVDMAAQKGTSLNDANYVYVVNSDGTVAVLNTERSQDIAAWTEWGTLGNFRAVAVVEDETFFLVRRTIDGVVTHFIERANELFFTDAAEQVTLSPAGTSVTGLDHLNGEVCRVRADGAVHPDRIPSGGAITLEYDATDVEVGLSFGTRLRSMPINLSLGDGPSLLQKTRIFRIRLDLQEAAGIRVNDKLIPDRKMDITNLNSAPALFTGVREVPNLGWGRIKEIKIEQSDPLPMTLLAMEAETESN